MFKKASSAHVHIGSDTAAGSVGCGGVAATDRLEPERDSGGAEVSGARCCVRRLRGAGSLRKARIQNDAMNGLNDQGDLFDSAKCCL